MAELSTSPSQASDSSIEINDLLFCAMHGKEQCDLCQADFREDNDLTLGVDYLARDGLEVDYIINQKDNSPQCKKHKSANCSNCFGFKKKIVKLNKDAAKAAKSRKAPESNF